MRGEGQETRYLTPEEVVRRTKPKPEPNVDPLHAPLHWPVPQEGWEKKEHWGWAVVALIGLVGLFVFAWYVTAHFEP